MYHHHRHPPTSNSTFTLVWNCTLTEVNTPSKEELINSSNTLVKQKSISCDDMAFMSNNDDQQIIENKPKQNGLL